MSKFLLQSGGGFFTLQGGGGVLELQSTVAGGATGTASLASVTMTAPAVTASAITDGTGTTALAPVTLSAPSATASSASDGNSSASLAPVTITAPSTTATGTTSATGTASIDALSIAAPDATASGTGNATAVVSIQQVTLAAPSSTGFSPGEIDVLVYPSFNFSTGGTTTDGVAVGDYIYAITASLAQLIVIDATDKNSLSVVTTIAIAGFPFKICSDGSFVYLTTSSGLSTLKKVDISTPTAPVVVDSVNLGTGLFAVAENGLYVYTAGSVSTVDTFAVYDKATLTLVTSAACLTNPQYFSIDGNNTYLSGESAGVSTLQVWDTTTTSAPSLLGSTSYGSSFGGQQLAASGDYVYSTSGASDIVVIDVSTPATPAVVYTSSSATTAFLGAQFTAGRYFSGISSSALFYWYDALSPTSPIFLDSILLSQPTSVAGMFRGGDYLYAIGFSGALSYVTPILFSVPAVSNTATINAPFIDVTPPSVSVSASSVKVSVSVPDITTRAPTIVVGSADNGIHKTVISQYANSPQILELVQNYADVFNAQRLLVDFVYNIWDVRTANSQGLDIWGRIVGVSRYLTLTNQDYFGFDPDFDPFNESPFFSGTAVTNTYILSDDDFRRVILAKALNNISKTTIPAIDRILNLLYGHRGIVFAQVTGDFELTYVFNFEPTAIDQAIAEAPDLLPKPAGFTIINDFVF